VKKEIQKRSLFGDIQLIALAAVEDQDWDYATRKACRKYSEIFHTPLHLVDELPLTYILQNLFEHMFEDMSPNDRAGFAAQLTMTPLEIEEREKEAGEDDNWLEEEAKREAARAAAPPSKARPPTPKAEPAPRPEPPPDANLTFEDLPPDKE